MANNTYIIESVDAVQQTMVVSFLVNNVEGARLNIPLPNNQTVDDIVRLYWPSSLSNPAGVAAATAIIGVVQTQNALTVAQAQAIQLDLLATGVADTIAGGYKSDALDPGGAVFTYPIAQTDQLNMIASVTDSIRVPPDWVSAWDYVIGDSVMATGVRLLCTVAGTSGGTLPAAAGTDGTVTWVEWNTLFVCEDASGVWGIRPHTASQIQQAGSDGKAFITALQIKNATLAAEIAGALTVAAVQTIVWSFP